MRLNLGAYNKSQCTSCFHKKVKRTDRPCSSCEYILTEFGGTIGSQHTNQNETIVVIRKDLDVLIQRVEQLEFEQLTTCKCTKSIVKHREESYNSYG